MRTTVKRVSLTVRAAVVGTAAVAGLVTATSAHAAAPAHAATSGQVAAVHAVTPSTTVELDQVWSGKCEALLYGNSSQQASAGVYESQTASSSDYCDGRLERWTGSYWYAISSDHYTFTPGTSDYTGFYWDGPGYEARVCVSDHTGVERCTGAWTIY